MKSCDLKYGRGGGESKHLNAVDRHSQCKKDRFTYSPGISGEICLAAFLWPVYTAYAVQKRQKAGRSVVREFSQFGALLG